MKAVDRHLIRIQNLNRQVHQSLIRGTDNKFYQTKKV